MDDRFAIQCVDLHVAYDRQEVLRGVSLDIPRGTLLPIVGPNGAGKTTLLKAMLGLAPIRKGYVHSAFLFSPPGYVPQQKTIDPIHPVSLLRIVEMGLYPRLGWWKRIGRDERARLQSILDRFGLWAHRHKTFGELSGGMKQKTLLARALATGTEVLLLDEPTSELDEETEAEILSQLQALVRERGKTVVLVHHGLHQAARMAPRVCWVEHGQVRWMESADCLHGAGPGRAQP